MTILNFGMPSLNSIKLADATGAPRALCGPFSVNSAI